MISLKQWSTNNNIARKTARELFVNGALPAATMRGKRTFTPANTPVPLEKRTRTTEDFVEKSKKQYAAEYDYSKAAYTGAASKVTVICPQHGEFFPVARDHARGKAGCPACANNQPRDLSVFIKQAAAVHGEKYGYAYVDDASRSYELELEECLLAHGVEYISNDKSVISQELDFYIPSAALAVEINGFYYTQFAVSVGR